MTRLMTLIDHYNYIITAVRQLTEEIQLVGID